MSWNWAVLWSSGVTLCVACGPAVTTSAADADTTSADPSTSLATAGSSTPTSTTASTDDVSTGGASSGSAATEGDGTLDPSLTGDGSTSPSSSTGSIDPATVIPDPCEPALAYQNFPIALPEGTQPFGVAPIELYGSPGRDLVVTDASGAVLVYGGIYGDPIGPLVLDVPSGAPHDVAIGDFDDASGLDIVVANGAADATNLWLWLADGVGGYARSSIALEGSPYTLASGRFNDGVRLDLAVLVDPGRGSVLELRGQGDGTFAEGFEFAVQSQPTEFATADLDGDGDADFFGTNTGQGGVLLREGLGNGYDNAGDLELADLATGATAADLDGDAIPELVVVSHGDGTHGRVWVWPGLGGFGYGAPTVWEAAAPLRFVIAVDADVDGLMDIVAGLDVDAPPYGLWVLRAREDEEACAFTIELDAPVNRVFAPVIEGDAPPLIVTTATSVELVYR